MLYVTFLQVPVAELRSAFTRVRFILPLLLTNFLIAPVLVAILINFLPDNSMLLLGVVLVLLSPCIDYVITFSQLGKSDSRLLLASTPVLLLMQMLMLPFYLHLFIGENASGLVQPGPFLDAFLWLIVLPLCFAIVTQLLSQHMPRVETMSQALGLLPVTATALVLFMVVTTMIPQLSGAGAVLLYAVPV